MSGGAGQGGGGSGSGFGGGIFIQGNQTITFAPTPGQTLAIDDPIGDQTGNGGTGNNAGVGSVVVSGGGTVILAADNTYSGGVTIDGGTTLELGSAAAAGSGAILFGAGANRLRIDGTTMPDNPISSTAPGDTIDLPSLTFVSAGEITPGANNVLQVVEGTASYAVHLDPAQDFTGYAFVLGSDGSGGTQISEEITAPDTVTPTNQSVAYQQSVGLGGLFAVSGPTPTQYQVWLNAPADGAVTDGSGAIATNTAVDETDLGSVNYIGGGTPGRDKLWLRVFDGQWSRWALATLTDPGVTPPTVTPIQVAQTVPADTVIAASNLFTVSNNSAAIAQYGFWDLGTGGGYFTVGGAVQGTNQEIDEPAAQLNQVNYVAGTGTGTDTLWVRANDGQWSNWSAAFTVTG